MSKAADNRVILIGSMVAMIIHLTLVGVSLILDNKLGLIGNCILYAMWTIIFLIAYARSFDLMLTPRAPPSTKKTY